MGGLIEDKSQHVTIQAARTQFMEAKIIKQVPDVVAESIEDEDYDDEGDNDDDDPLFDSIVMHKLPPSDGPDGGSEPKKQNFNGSGAAKVHSMEAAEGDNV
jgi:hypothetical protein